MNSVSKPFIAFHFRDCFPLSLSSIDLQTNLNDSIIYKQDEFMPYKYVIRPGNNSQLV
jgi:hypothetical protein